MTNSEFFDYPLGGECARLVSFAKSSDAPLVADTLEIPNTPDLLAVRLRDLLLSWKDVAEPRAILMNLRDYAYMRPYAAGTLEPEHNSFFLSQGIQAHLLVETAPEGRVSLLCGSEFPSQGTFWIIAHDNDGLVKQKIVTS